MVFLAMRTAIDAAGRLVVPKALRDLMGLRAGQGVTMEVRDGRLEVEPAVVPMRLEDGPDGVRGVADDELPVLTAEQVRASLERTRR